LEAIMVSVVLTGQVGYASVFLAGKLTDGGHHLVGDHLVGHHLVGHHLVGDQPVGDQPVGDQRRARAGG
jgi:hypothetical protein